jgi:DNA-binding transcriptional LysR family regulator
MESWDDMRFFLAVCRAGTFTGAGKALGVEQSTVSRRVAALEEGLGHKVFERVGSALVLTELGAGLIAHAEQVEAQVVAMRELADGQTRGVSGRVRVATTSSLATWVVAPLLAEVMAAHEGLSVEVLTGSRSLDLARREAELALRFVRPGAGDLLVKRVAELETCVVAQRGYVERMGSAPELGRIDWIMVDPDGAQAPEEAFLRSRVRGSARWQTNDYMLQVEWLRMGLGAAVVPRALVRLFPELVVWELGLGSGPTLELFLATPRPLRELPRVRVVWEALEQVEARFEGSFLQHG